MINQTRILFFALVACFALSASAQIGSGWSQYFPEWTYHVPPTASDYGERYTLINGEFHLWVLSSDPSSFPGNDSGPRSEVRVKNEYTSGNQQFEADVKVMSGCDKVGIFQIWYRPAPWMIRVYGTKFYNYGNGASFATVPFGTYQRFNSIHTSSTRNLKLYFNGQQVLNYTIRESDGSSPYYNKFGVYGRDGMGASNHIYYKNVKYFKSTTSNTNQPPSVSISSPANDATFTPPATVTITATASDADGSISKVEFYNGSTLLGTDTSSPYSYTWTNVAAGTYSITAKATDNDNSVNTSSAVTVKVNTTSNTAPTVSISSPANDATFTPPASVTITATASDADGSVSKVEFYNGSTLLGTDTSSPYSYTWNDVAAGTYSLSARATDDKDTVTTSSAVEIRVNQLITHTVPGKIEAEEYSAMSGIQTEATADEGAGLNAGYIISGDWMDYAVNVQAEGSYKVSFRVATIKVGGQIELRSGAEMLGSVDIDSTGGWQTWATVSTIVQLSSGAQTLRLAFLGGSGNLMNVNWFAIEDQTTAIQGIPAATEKSALALNGRNINGSMQLEVSLPGSGVFKLDVYDITGRQLFSHSGTNAASGINTVVWNGKQRNNSKATIAKLSYSGKIVVQKVNFIK